MKQGIDKTLFDKLHGYGEAPPEQVWERIERSLAEAGAAAAAGEGAGPGGDSAGPGAPSGRAGALARSGSRRRAIRVTAAGLAAAVALAMLLVGPVARMQRQFAQQMPVAIMPIGACDASVFEDPANQAVAGAGQAAAPVTAAACPAPARTMAAVTTTPEPDTPGPETYSTPLPDEGTSQPERTAGQTGQEPGQPQQRASQSSYGGAYGNGASGSYSQSVYAAARNSYNPIRRNRPDRNRVSTTLYAANLGGGGSSVASGNPVSAGGYQLMEVVTRAADRPGVVQSTPEITSSNHRLPLSFGAGVAFGVSPRLSLETGLNYTYLRSDFEASGMGNYQMNQELHYLGVPVALIWRFADVGPVGLYLRGGGMLEKGIKGTMRTTIPDTDYNDTQSIAMKGLQPSLNAAVGLQFNLGGAVGLYVEPGFNYYPTMQQQPGNYRTENPVTFGLRAGLRLNLGK